MHYFQHFDLDQADHYPHKTTRWHLDTELVTLSALQRNLATRNQIVIPSYVVSYMEPFEQDLFYKWVYGIHIKHKLKTNDIDDLGAVFAQQVKEIVNQIGWSQEAVQEITIAWALYYGRYLYEFKNGFAPVYGSKFIQAALEADNLEDVLANKEL